MSDPLTQAAPGAQTSHLTPLAGEAGREGSVLLEAVGIAKRFGGVQALKDVSLTIKRGEIYGLIGPNGAGKTTFFNVLTGLYSRDGGDILFNGKPLALGNPSAVAAAGIARTFQNIRLFANMTALENVMVGRHGRTRSGLLGAVLRSRSNRAEEAAIQRRAEELLRYVGISHRANDLARNLSYGDQRRLEIARALATDPLLLALDEPAAGMNATETAELRKLIEGLRNDGLTILLIEHDVKLVMGLCDRLAVLDYGEKIAEDVPEVVQKNPKVIEAYLGDTSHHPDKPSADNPPSPGLPRQAGEVAAHPLPRERGWEDGGPLLAVTNLEVRYGGIAAVKGVSFAVEEGEMVCLIGTNGAGKTSTLKALARMLPSRGEIHYLDQRIDHEESHTLIGKGLALVPEGRGVFARMSVAENLAMGAYLRRDQEVRQDEEEIYRLLPRLKERRDQLAGTLSGGEQQMLAIGRALMGRPRLLLLDEPSMGLAPIMVDKVFELIRAIAAKGVSILLVEQNARLALETCQRGYVMESGCITLADTASNLAADPRVRTAYLGE